MRRRSGSQPRLGTAGVPDAGALGGAGARELDFAQHRQLFLTEQGYSYQIEDENKLAAPALAMT